MFERFSVLAGYRSIAAHEAVALYNLLKGINQRHAVLMVILLVVSVPIAFLNALNSIAGLIR